ncbi:uncharacterized protein EV422DRAFT_521186 [Fimicolochytrium jonesii]|uniref:uncharacterized protein n=1 Tax=Fimicolochytrium jonesii TaxID=1396493 RepID=UPI0022FF1925|nr:uncharacterized protein EV422DRAFT_521186 [Fimicolochytrium jonesii]KAI8823483.1 hypothetical protein EV422DRAFT_521186 [Fimicolochytrium jonesii]
MATCHPLNLRDYQSQSLDNGFVITSACILSPALVFIFALNLVLYGTGLFLGIISIFVLLRRKRDWSSTALAKPVLTAVGISLGQCVRSAGPSRLGLGSCMHCLQSVTPYLVGYTGTYLALLFDAPPGTAVLLWYGTGLAANFYQVCIAKLWADPIRDLLQQKEFSPTAQARFDLMNSQIERRLLIILGCCHTFIASMSIGWAFYLQKRDAAKAFLFFAVFTTSSLICTAVLQNCARTSMNQMLAHLEEAADFVNDSAVTGTKIQRLRSSTVNEPLCNLAGPAAEEHASGPREDVRRVIQVVQVSRQTARFSGYSVPMTQFAVIIWTVAVRSPESMGGISFLLSMRSLLICPVIFATIWVYGIQVGLQRNRSNKGSSETRVSTAAGASTTLRKPVTSGTSSKSSSQNSHQQGFSAAHEGGRSGRFIGMGQQSSTRNIALLAPSSRAPPSVFEDDDTSPFPTLVSPSLMKRGAEINGQCSASSRLFADCDDERGRSGGGGLEPV